MARKKKSNTEELVVTVEQAEVTNIENPEVVYDAPNTLEGTPAEIAADINDQDLSLVSPEKVEEILTDIGFTPEEVKEPEAATVVLATPATEAGPATSELESQVIQNLGINLPPGFQLADLFPNGVPATVIPVPVTTPESVGSAGEVTVNDLAEELGIQPKSLRSRLRKSGYKKAGKTWGWSPDSPELAEIRAKFTRQLEPAQPEPTPPTVTA